MAKRGNGEGTIYYSEKLNKWIGQFTAGRKADGKLNRKSVYGNTRKDAADINFDDDFIYKEIPLPMSERTIPMEQVDREEAIKTFEAWSKKMDKIEY